MASMHTFLFDRRNLLRYGGHLSPMLLEIARTLAPEAALLPAPEPRHSNGNGHGWASLAELDDGESPYRD